MIVGDPFNFSLQFDVVDNWNLSDDSWRNGVFALYINGERVFSVVDVFELRAIISFYSNAPIEELRVNDTQIDSSELYKVASEYFWGDGSELLDGLFDLTATAMIDSACFLYFIKTSVGDRLVWKVGSERVKELYLEVGTVLDVIKRLRPYNL
ncbi:Imm42 family immunity protein [Achromobacter kerstersii]